MSAELAGVLTWMEDQLAVDYPTAKLNLNYFMLAILEVEECLAHKRISSCISSMSMSSIRNSYTQLISTKALTIIKPGREMKIDDKLMNAILGGKKQAELLNPNVPNGGEVTSEHVLLEILYDESENNKIKAVFETVGLTASMLLNKMLEDKMDKLASMNISHDDVDNYDEIDDILDSANNDKKKIVDIGKKMIAEFSGVKKQEKRRGKTPNIDTYCTNLNDLVDNDKIDVLVGREKEVTQIIQALGRRKKNNVVLVGDGGVGKTAIAENIAVKIKNGEVPEFMRNKILVSLNMTAIMAGTTLRGMFEERVQGILNEIKRSGDYILLIDNIGEVFSSNSKNDYDISAMMSSALENGDLQVIGTADFKSYRSTFDKDSSLARRFRKIIVEKPTIEESYDILHGIKGGYEKYHLVKYTDTAINACVDLAEKYITERNLPDAAIDLMDEAGSLIGTSVAAVPDDVKEITKEISTLKGKIAELRSNSEFEESDKIEKEVSKLIIEVNDKMKEYQAYRTEHPTEIDENVILDIVSTKTGIPIYKLNVDEKQRLMTMADRIKAEVIGQDAAVDEICKSIKRNRIGLSDNKCIFSALLQGPTGVGKTLIAKKLAKEMFGDEKSLIRFDMSEYSDKTSVNKLIGSSAGYVGYEAGGLLTEAVKNKKYCVLLLDEIEKADQEVYNIFLQVLDEGFLTDNSGMRVDFKNTIILFTSNVGARAASEFGRGIGFNENADENVKRIQMKELKKKFPPEFINRLNNVIYFNGLSDWDLKRIIALELFKMNGKLNALGYLVSENDAVIDYIFSIVEKEREYGARPIIRAIQDEIENKLTDLLLEKEYEENHAFYVTSDGNQCIIFGQEEASN